MIVMLWMLLLAHFLGDFPLQPDWMVRRKSNVWVLLLHVSIHFVLMLLLVGKVRLLILPHLLLLNAVHMAQDRLKKSLTDFWPGRMVGLFFVDQLLHCLAIWGLVTWVQSGVDIMIIEQNPVLAIIAIAYLVVTYTWYISERVINHADREYLTFIEETKVSRMLARSGIISIFFIVHAWAGSKLALLLTWPYPESIYRKRAIISDLSISIIVIIFLVGTLGLG